MAINLTSEQKKFLLETARTTINNQTKSIWFSNDEIENFPPIFLEKRGCFVTLNKHSQLRGCIGYIMPIAPLYKAVIENAYNAAFGDPRFPPVSKNEINDLHIEISVLSVPQKLDYSDKNDLLNKLNPRIDGVIIKKDFYSATFLPQVWDQLPDKNDFLTHLCLKAGLNGNEWQKGALDIEIYHADFFEENNN